MTEQYIIEYLVYYGNLGPSRLVMLDDDEKPLEFSTRDAAQRHLVKEKDNLLPGAHHIVTQTFKV